MSPVSSRKCSDPGARVQAPFTLSDTSTCPGSLYWENHPTSRSPPATGLVSVTVVVRTRSPVENAVPWTKVGVVAWPTAGRARRAARAAITARRAPDGADGKSFMGHLLLYKARMARAGTCLRFCLGFDSTPCRARGCIAGG